MQAVSPFRTRQLSPPVAEEELLVLGLNSMPWGSTSIAPGEVCRQALQGCADLAERALNHHLQYCPWP